MSAKRRFSMSFMSSACAWAAVECIKHFLNYSTLRRSQFGKEWERRLRGYTVFGQVTAAYISLSVLEIGVGVGGV